MRILLAALIVAACGDRAPSRQLDLDLIEVSSDARLRTDTIGGGAFTDTATFVLVDARNRADKGAHVTLGGALTDGTGAIGTLNPQSLWIPPGESRTFALIDSERKPRPAAKAARIEVRGALIPDDPPRARVEELHTFKSDDRVIVQAYAVNGADRLGQIMVIGVFHDAQNRPMTRPFELVTIAAGERRVVKFVGPSGSVRGAIFLGDAVY